MHFTTQSRLTSGRHLQSPRQKTNLHEAELPCWNDWIELFYHENDCWGSVSRCCDGGVSLFCRGIIYTTKPNVKNYWLKWKNWYVWWIIIWLQQQQFSSEEGEKRRQPALEIVQVITCFTSRCRMNSNTLHVCKRRPEVGGYSEARYNSGSAVLHSLGSVWHSRAFCVGTFPRRCFGWGDSSIIRPMLTCKVTVCVDAGLL